MLVQRQAGLQVHGAARRHVGRRREVGRHEPARCLVLLLVLLHLLQRGQPGERELVMAVQQRHVRRVRLLLRQRRVQRQHARREAGAGRGHGAAGGRGVAQHCQRGVWARVA